MFQVLSGAVYAEELLLFPRVSLIVFLTRFWVVIFVVAVVGALLFCFLFWSSLHLGRFEITDLQALTKY